MARGKVKWFDVNKGYGFLSRDNGGYVFVHHSVIQGSEFKILTKGQEVEFEVQEDLKLPIAIYVRPL